MSSMALILENENWAQAEVALEFQSIVNSIVCPVNSEDDLFQGLSPRFRKPLQASSKANDEGSMQTQRSESPIQKEEVAHERSEGMNIATNSKDSVYMNSTIRHKSDNIDITVNTKASKEKMSLTDSQNEKHQSLENVGEEILSKLSLGFDRVKLKFQATNNMNKLFNKNPLHGIPGGNVATAINANAVNNSLTTNAINHDSSSFQGSSLPLSSNAKLVPLMCHFSDLQLYRISNRSM